MNYAELKAQLARLDLHDLTDTNITGLEICEPDLRAAALGCGPLLCARVTSEVHHEFPDDTGAGYPVASAASPEQQRAAIAAEVARQRRIAESP